MVWTTDSIAGTAPGWIHVDYVHSPSGRTTGRNRYLQSGDDEQAAADALLPSIETGSQNAEREQAWGTFSTGGDIDVGVYDFNTLTEVQSYCWQRNMNLMRDALDDEGKSQVMIAIIPYLNAQNNSTIAALLPGWNVPMVQDARGRINTCFLGRSQLDHGEPPFPDVP